MEPTEPNEAPIVISTPENLICDPAIMAELPMDVSTGSSPCESNMSMELRVDIIGAQSSSFEGGAVDRRPDGLDW